MTTLFGNIKQKSCKKRWIGTMTTEFIIFCGIMDITYQSQQHKSPKTHYYSLKKSPIANNQHDYIKQSQSYSPMNNNNQHQIYHHQ